MVLTSHDRLGDTGKNTGFWLEEFAAPYYVFKDAGAAITLASPKGGQPPLDPKSDEPDAQTKATQRFKQDQQAQDALAGTLKLSSVSADDYDAVFYPGGHGPLWDLSEDAASIALIEAMYAAGKPVAAVCHAPGVLRRTKAPGGAPLVQGKAVTGFANSEEAAVGLTDVVPFLVEDALKKLGGNYSKTDDWKPYTVCDGNLITGQNPASSEAGAEAVLQQLRAGDSTVAVALLVRLEVKPGKEADVESFLRGGLSIVQEETATSAWFAFRLGPSTFGIFDAFPDEAGRQAHLSGRVAAALMEKAPELFAQPPVIEKVDVLAAKLPK
nr:DJ-1/PfpI family protein [Gloeobacter morelensis]